MYNASLRARHSCSLKASERGRGSCRAVISRENRNFACNAHGLAAKLRIAFSHDIFIGQGSISGFSKTGRCRSQVRLLLFTDEGLNSFERIFTTITQIRARKDSSRGSRAQMRAIAECLPHRLPACFESDSMRRAASGQSEEKRYLSKPDREPRIRTSPPQVF